MQEQVLRLRPDDLQILGPVVGSDPVPVVDLFPLHQTAPQDLFAAVDWVIAGGESGPGARDINPDWVRNIRDQCAAADVPFFFKQWSGRSPKTLGRELDGRTHDAMPKLFRDYS